MMEQPVCGASGPCGADEAAESISVRKYDCWIYVSYLYLYLVPDVALLGAASVVLLVDVLVDANRTVGIKETSKVANVDFHRVIQKRWQIRGIPRPGNPEPSRREISGRV